MKAWLKINSLLFSLVQEDPERSDMMLYHVKYKQVFGAILLFIKLTQLR
jgi:hypothetical protein